MEKEIIFSIIIPVYNTEQYLHECIESVLGQKEESFEIILVDDGSTDHSGLICDQYASLYPNYVTVIHQKNKGLLMTRREGIQHAKGMYVMHLDSDDYLKEGALDILHHLLQHSNADMALFQISRSEDFSVPYTSIPFKSFTIFQGKDKEKVYEMACGSSAVTSLCSKATKREIIDIERDYSVFSSVRDGEDLVQSLPLLDAAKCIVYSDEMLYFYRKNPQSMSNSYSPFFYQSMKVAQGERLKYAKKWDSGDGKLINMARVRCRMACITALKLIVKSDLSWAMKKEKIDEIVKDPFYLSVKDISNKSLSLKSKVIAFLVENRIFFVLKYISMIKN